MVQLELARLIQADREREIRGRERGFARVSTGPRHPVGPDHGLVDEPARPRRPLVVRTASS